MKKELKKRQINKSLKTEMNVEIKWLFQHSAKRQLMK